MTAGMTLIVNCNRTNLTWMSHTLCGPHLDDATLVMISRNDVRGFLSHIGPSRPYNKSIRITLLLFNIIINEHL